MELLFPLLILLLFIPIFLSGRRQKRQMQEMQQMQAALKPGDVVITTSGLRGAVVDTSYEDTIDIEIADGVVTTWVRGAVREKVKHEDASSDISSDDASDDASTDAADASTDRADVPSLEKVALDKDESSNGTARS